MPTCVLLILKTSNEQYTNHMITEYLLSVLCPNKMFFDDFIFEPPLEELQGASSPVQLHLYVCVPYQIPPEAYSASAPIGTGRPISKAFVASSKSCSSPSEARQSLAEALLADRDAFSFVAARFTLLSTLYSLPMASIAGIKRGMAAMAQTSASELSARLKQLRDAGVNHSWEFDAQLERLLLEEMFPLKQKSLLRGGMWQLQMWIGCVEVALWLSQERREFFAEVYGEAGAFLKTALQSMPGGSWNAEGSFA